MSFLCSCDNFKGENFNIFKSFFGKLRISRCFNFKEFLIVFIFHRLTPHFNSNKKCKFPNYHLDYKFIYLISQKKRKLQKNQSLRVLIGATLCNFSKKVKVQKFP